VEKFWRKWHEKLGATTQGIQFGCRELAGTLGTLGRAFKLVVSSRRAIHSSFFDTSSVNPQ